MKGLTNIKAVYLIGIGGIGMSGLARYFAAQGKLVAGYDRTPTDLTKELESAGISVRFADDVDAIPAEFKNAETTLVIYTPAVPTNHSELNYFRNNGFEVLKRSQVLGELSRTYNTVAVAGTHGKTTTSSIIAHLLKCSSKDCNAFLGGISSNYNTNLLTSTSSNLMVVEADEFDRSFLTLSPDIAIVTSVDADHLDIYGSADEMLKSFHEFTEKITADGTLIYRFGLPFSGTKKKHFTYSLSEASDYYTSNLSIESGQYRFNLHSPSGIIKDLKFGMPGLHNVENAVAAFAAVDQLGLSEDEIRIGFATYKGVKRRFEVHINTEELVYIDDYAHHPTEISACVNSVRELFPGRKVKAVFQPHLFSRTKDHMEEFAHSLSALDEVTLLEIYPAREEPMAGITSSVLLDKITAKNKKLQSKTAVLESITKENTDVLLTLGAGDIDQLVSPIKAKLLS
ncbi:MAG: UDP-N-acetylmuramate--L-alanine ligase [Flavobacteriales bacterium]|nr:UDP-N-acetylmuramate--L-alanine ligase [Flavobacteriales bacterium]